MRPLPVKDLAASLVIPVFNRLVLMGPVIELRPGVDAIVRLIDGRDLSTGKRE